jgi:hypothetical protein
LVVEGVGTGDRLECSEVGLSMVSFGPCQKKSSLVISENGLNNVLEILGNFLGVNAFRRPSVPARGGGRVCVLWGVDG